MEYEITKTTLINFLKRNQAYEKYVHEVNQTWISLNTFDERLDRIIKQQIGNPKDIIACNFYYQKKRFKFLEQHKPTLA